MYICSVLLRPYDICRPVSYTQPKISVTYLILTAELTRGLVIYIVLIFLLLVHNAIKNLDLHSDLELLILELAVAGLDTSLRHRDSKT